MRAHNIGDLQAAARRRLPRIVWRYIEGGAEDELTLRANREAFESIYFSPFTLVDVSQRSQKTAVFGQSYDSPFGIAPMSPLGLCRHDADIAMARAARAANVPYVLSTHSFVPLERVARESGAAPWFQVYLPADRARAEAELERARRAGCEVLMVTTDVPVRGNREYNERNRFDVPLRFDVRTLAEGLLHPRWLVDVYLRSIARRRRAAPQRRRDLHDWRDFAWLREAWRGKLVVKGILAVDDARLAAQHGADGIVVSNHGGRQLDGARATLEALPAIAASLKGRIAIFADGGVRRGADIAKMLSLGADMAFVGRAALYGVAAGAEAGARRALHILMTEIDRVMALLGCNSVDELGPHCIGRERSTPDSRPPTPKAAVVRLNPGSKSGGT